MKQQHHPHDIKTYQKGIQSDTNKEILGRLEDGQHVDALNMRSMSMDGDNLAKKKIKGEELLYDALDNRCFVEVGPLPGAETYECMMTQEVNGHIIELWASTEPGRYPPFIRIDGQIVLMSEYLPFNLNYPVQYDKNESCVGGEIYITDNNVSPMVLSVLDMMDNSAMTETGECTQKYFGDFDPANYSVPVSSELYKPAFIKQESVSTASGYDATFGTSGLVIGSYSYSYRLVTAEGERTPFSPITELIPVVRRKTSQFSPQYPYSHTHGDFANIASSTDYGNHIRIKCENADAFTFLEVRRDAWQSDSAYGVPPVSAIIGSLPINNGLNVINIFDKAEANFTGLEILDLAEQTDTFASIRRAKSVRYFNERLYLMNIGYNSRDINGEVTFVDEAGTPAFPTIEKLGKAGHKHPYTAAMYKSNMRGDKTGFGVVLFDSFNNPTYATELPAPFTNYQFPNRRDEVSSDTQGTSYKGLVKAATTGGDVELTHEVFDHYDASQKKTGPFYDPVNVEIEFHNAPYKTLTPTSQSSTQSTLDTSPNEAVSLDSSAPEDPYRPHGFGLDYYSQGLAVKGLDTYPDWADGFSVVQTDPAYQVVAQGLGFYKVNRVPIADATDRSVNNTKDVDKFWAYFPDLEHRFPDIAEDLLNNPTSYSVQLVSPMGYFTEVYASKRDSLVTTRQGVDMITYARVLRDGAAADINNYYAQTGKSGIPDADGFSYVAYGRFMNSVSGDSPAFPGNTQGNTIFPLDVSTTEITTAGGGRQTYFEIGIDTTSTGDIYNTFDPGFGTDSNSPGQEEWREPMYVINLYKNRDINSGITTQYKYTGHYVKFKSLVLESNGTSNQSATLVSERWEDCIPSLSGEVYNNYSGLKRFVYVVDTNGVEKRWMNVTFETIPDVATILAGLAAAAPGPYNDPILTGGFDIFGIYRSTETSVDLCPQFTLNFIENPLYTAFTVPVSGTKVYIKYDNRIPVRVFGGDTFINESIWAVLDNEYNSNADPIGDENEFIWSNPFPFKQYKYNNNFPTLPYQGYRWWENTQGPNEYGYDEHQFCNSDLIIEARKSRIRQLVTMWTAETRCNLSFFFNLESPDKAVSEQAFPLINYIPRPYKWDNSADPTDRAAWEAANNLLPEYYDDYGYEWNWWGWGGFRFLPQTNKDYSKSQTTTTYTSVPTVGFTEQTDFCTRVIWSLKRPINAQNTPSVRTFPSSNYFDLSDDTGEIKFAWSALSGDKGNNLYAFTDSGVCLLMVDKRVIYEINANELATAGSSIGGILNQLWIDKRIGMSDQTWRSWAEYSNALFFINNKSAYMFTDNQLTDISRTGFHELFRREFLAKLGPVYQSDLVGGYNVLNGEYIMNVKDAEDFSTLIYGVEQQALQCQSTYNYDKYLYNNNLLYGMKDVKTFELGVGNQIDGEDMECYVTGLSNADLHYDKEFIRIRVSSNSKPERVYFYGSYQDYINDNYTNFVDTVAVPLSMKDYFGYECYIPRNVVAPYYRQQGRVMLFKIVSSADEEFLVASTGVQYKRLK
jgi:hypothetical protein